MSAVEAALAHAARSRADTYAPDSAAAHLVALADEVERLRAVEARALHMLNDDDMTAPGWSIRRYCARVILGDG